MSDSAAALGGSPSSQSPSQAAWNRVDEEPLGTPQGHRSEGGSGSRGTGEELDTETKANEAAQKNFRQDEEAGPDAEPLKKRCCYIFPTCSPSSPKAASSAATVCFAAAGFGLAGYCFVSDASATVAKLGIVGITCLGAFMLSGTTLQTSSKSVEDRMNENFKKEKESLKKLSETKEEHAVEVRGLTAETARLNLEILNLTNNLERSTEQSQALGEILDSIGSNIEEYSKLQSAEGVELGGLIEHLEKSVDKKSQSGRDLIDFMKKMALREKELMGQIQKLGENCKSLQEEVSLAKTQTEEKTKELEKLTQDTKELSQEMAKLAQKINEKYKPLKQEVKDFSGFALASIVPKIEGDDKQILIEHLNVFRGLVKMSLIDPQTLKVIRKSKSEPKGKEKK